MPDDNITGFLGPARQGDREAQDRLYRAVEAYARAVAHRLLRRYRPGAVVQTTMLVDDAFQRLMAQARVHWKDHRHFFAVLALQVERCWVTELRRYKAQKRGGGEIRALDPELVREIADQRTEAPEEALMRCDDALLLAEALAELDQSFPEHAELIRLHWFLGLSAADLADQMEMSLTKVKTRLAGAKAVLGAALRRRGYDDDGRCRPRPEGPGDLPGLDRAI